MLSEIGYGSLLCLMLSIYKSTRLLEINKLALILIQNVIIIVFIMFLSLYSDIFFEFIVSNSSINDKIYNKLFSFWTKHNGSLLLWVLILIVYKYNLYIKFVYKNITINFIEKINKFYTIYIIYFVIFIIFINNIFYKNINDNHFYFVDKESNVSLQNILLLIHPPILYYGYLGILLLFFINLVINLNRYILIKNYMNIIYYKLNIIYIFLFFGMFLGSLWAYNEIGWGGWWFWDPIENISLILWLFINFIIHIIKFNYFNLSFFIDIINFFFFVFNYYSKIGVMNSVHMFSFHLDYYNYNFLGLFMLIILLVFIYFNNKLLSIHRIKFNLLNNSFLVNLIIYGLYILLLYIVLIIIGILLPIILLKSLNLNVLFGVDYYNFISLGLLLLLLLFMNLYIINIKYLLLVIISNIYILYNMYIDTYVEYIYSMILINLIWFGIYMLFIKLINIKHIYMSLSHLSFYLLIISILINSKEQYAIAEEINKYKDIKYFNLNVIFRNYFYLEYKNYISLTLNILIKVNDTNLIVNPELKQYENFLYSNNVLLSNIFNDIHIMLIKNGTDGVFLKMIINPFINMIWFNSILLIWINFVKLIHKYKSNIILFIKVTI